VRDRVAPPIQARLLVLAKEPLPGRVKTRLTPEFTPIDAAALALAAIEDTFAVVAEAVGALARRGVRVEPLVVLDGRPEGWVPSAFRVVRQVSGGLDERIAAALAAGSGAAASTTPHPPTPCLLVGMDTPQMSMDVLADALRGLVEAPGPHACLGPAADGGWWALGMNRPAPGLLRGIVMSTSTTGAATARRLFETGFAVRPLPLLTDVDTAEAAATVAAEAPRSRFAAVHARLDRVAS
jgi:glycosyltransferase A (GT-A) superfamily protein (DUF2064 family)